MRKKGILLILALTGLLSSCNDAIDIEQPGQVTNPSEIYKTPKDIQRGLMGIYALLPGESEIEFVSVFTDEVAIGIANGGQGLISGEYGFLMQPGNGFASSAWGGYYRVINQINRLLKSNEDLMASASAADLQLLKDYKANLLTLRAYANYKLFAYFTPNYTNPSGLSIMKLDFMQTDDYSKVIGRSTVSEIKKFILDDLSEAELNFTQGQVSSVYVTQGLVDAIRTKLYAMVGDYPNVITSGQAVLALPQNQIGTVQDFADYFNNKEISKEIIFQLQRVRGNASVASAWYSASVGSNGSPFYEMGRSLYNELDKLDPANTNKQVNVSRNDVRYEVNVLYLNQPGAVSNVNSPQYRGSFAMADYETLPQAEYVAKDKLFIGKYLGKRSESLPLQNNIPVMRSADIYLAIAEARANAGEINSTATSINSLYTDGQNGNSVEGILFFLKANRSHDRSLLVREAPFNNAQEAWKAILDARRVEFAFEGHRYLDMKRIGAKAGSPGFQRYSKDAIVNGTTAGLPVTDHRMTLPIPTSELNSNPIIKGQQNPGY